MMQGKPAIENSCPVGASSSRSTSRSNAPGGLRPAEGIKVSGIPLSTPAKLLELYFKNTVKSRGGEIKSLTYECGKDTTAIIVFKDESVHHRVAEYDNHRINNATLFVEIIAPVTPPKPEFENTNQGLRVSGSHVVVRCSLTPEEALWLRDEGNGIIARLRQQSGCSICVSLLDDGIEWSCVVTGAPEDVNKAKQLVEKVLQNPAQTFDVTQTYTSSVESTGKCIASAQIDPSLSDSNLIKREKSTDCTETARVASQSMVGSRDAATEDKEGAPRATCTAQAAEVNGEGESSTLPHRPERGETSKKPRYRKRKPCSNRDTRQQHTAAPKSVATSSKVHPSKVPSGDGGGQQNHEQEITTKDTPGVSQQYVAGDVAEEGVHGTTVADQPQDDRAAAEIEVPTSFVPFIIGKAGDTIRQLETSWGVTIRIMPGPVTGHIAQHNTRKGHLRSSKHCRVEGADREMVTKAVDAIKEILTPYDSDISCSNRENYEGDNHVGRDGSNVDTLRDVKAYMIISGSVCGRVIGRGGEVIRGIEEMSGAKVQLKDNECLTNGRCCVIRGGDKASIRLAAVLVAEKAGMAFPECIVQNTGAVDHGAARGDARAGSAATVPVRAYVRSNVLLASNLSCHTSQEAIWCWLWQAAGSFPAEIYFSVNRSKIVAIFEHGIDEASIRTFADANGVDGRKVQTKVLPMTSRVQVHNKPQDMGIIELLNCCRNSVHCNTVSAEYILRDRTILNIYSSATTNSGLPFLLANGWMDVKGTVLQVTPHFDELGLLLPDHMVHRKDLHWLLEFPSTRIENFGSPYLIVSGFADEVGHASLRAYLSAKAKSGGGKIQSFQFTDDRAVVAFEDPQDAYTVLRKPGGHSIGATQLNVAIVEGVHTETAFADRHRFIIKNAGEATSDSLKYILWTSCGTPVVDIEFVQTHRRGVKVLVTFDAPLEISRVSWCVTRIPLDGRMLEAEEVMQCTSVLVQNVPSDAHGDVLELAFHAAECDVSACKKVASHTWLVEVRDMKSMDKVLFSRVTYASGTDLVIAADQDFCALPGVGQKQGQRASHKLRLSFVSPSVLTFVMANLQSEFRQLLSKSHCSLEEDGNCVYFKLKPTDREYWGSYKMWRLLKPTVAAYTEDILCHDVPVIGDLVESLISAPDLLERLKRIAVGAASVQVSLKRGARTAAGTLEIIGKRRNVEATVPRIWDILESEPAFKEVCQTVVSHFEQGVRRLVSELLDVVKFEETVSNVTVQLFADSQVVVLGGRFIDVQRAYLVLRNVQLAMAEKIIKGSVAWIELMSRSAVQTHVRQELLAAGLSDKLVWSVSSQETVSVLAISSEVADRGARLIEGTVVDWDYPMTPSFLQISRTPLWREFNSELHDKYQGSVITVVSESEQQLRVTCCCLDIEEIMEDLRSFLSVHTVNLEHFDMPDILVSYIDSYCTDAIKEIEERHADKLVKIRGLVGPGCKNAGFEVEGNDEGIKSAMDELHALSICIKQQMQPVDVPGAASYFRAGHCEDVTLAVIGRRTKTMLRVSLGDSHSAAATTNLDFCHHDAAAAGTHAYAAHRDDAGWESAAFAAGQCSSNIMSGTVGKGCQVGDVSVCVVPGDISKETTAVIVNSTSRDMSFHGQVSQALCRNAGHTWEADCRNIGPIDSTGVLLTSAGSLKSKYVMHVDVSLGCEQVVRECLMRAQKIEADSIAFPSIGTGTYGKPADGIAQTMLTTTVNFLKGKDNKYLKSVRFVMFDQAAFTCFVTALEKAVCRPKAKFGSIFAMFRPSNVDEQVEMFDVDSSFDQPYDVLTPDLEAAIKSLNPPQKAWCSICGSTEDDIAEALKLLIDACNNKLNRKKIEEPKEVISDLTPNQVEHMEKYCARKDVRVQINSSSHEINLASVDAESLSHVTDFIRDLLLKHRRQGAQVRCTPSTWLSCDKYALVPLNPSTQEYVNVERAFRAGAGLSGSRATIIMVTRVENPTLWMQYTAYKEQVKKTMISGTNPLERKLWHGTSESAIESICHNGFNRSYCGKNAVVYGQGVYFARDASYSANDVYSVPNNRNEKLMIYCDVITGDYHVGDSSVRVPRDKPRQSVVKYECTVDTDYRPTIFVTYNDNQAYPTYVIKFKHL